VDKIAQLMIRQGAQVDVTAALDMVKAGYDYGYLF